jgi:hypothetical protein
MGAGPPGPSGNEGDETGRARATIQGGRNGTNLRQAWVLNEAIRLQPEGILLAAYRDCVPELSGAQARPRRDLRIEAPRLRPEAEITLVAASP